MTKTDTKPETPTSALVNITCNIVMPVFVLNKYTDELGALTALVVALAFPFGFFIYEYIKVGKANWISVLGFINTLLTGSFALFQLEGKWFAIKEAGFPFLIGAFVFFNSFYGKKPFVEKLLLNPSMFLVDELNAALSEKKTTAAFYKHLRKTNIYLSYSFFLSAILNFVLAFAIFKEIDPTISVLERSNILNEQISKMTWMGYLVILLPSIACMFFIFQYLARGIKEYSGLQMMDLMKKQ